MKWFKHDSAAQMDAKLRKLRAKYGMEGYGLYWYCLELIAQNVEKHNLTFELEHDAEVIAMDVNLGLTLVEDMMRYMVSLNLFEMSESGVVTCLKMLTRTDEYTQKLINKSESVGRVSGQKPEKSELIEEKRREEKRKDITSPGRAKKFIPPSVSQVREYCQERKNGIDPQRFVDSYQAKDWMIGKSKMKDWQAAVRTWEKNNPKPQAGKTLSDEMGLRGVL